MQLQPPILQIPSTAFTHRQIDYGQGGGLLAGGRSVVRLERVLFSNNSATNGADLASTLTVDLTLLPGTNIGAGNDSVLWARTLCLTGEVLADGEYCTACGANLFAVTPNATACQLCPARAACPGGDALEPLQGHWHSHPFSALIHECPTPEACPCAPNLTRPGACAASPCAEGYTGNLCGACAPGFAVTGLFKCGKCLRTALLVPLYVLSMLAVLCLMVSKVGLGEVLFVCVCVCVSLGGGACAMHVTWLTYLSWTYHTRATRCSTRCSRLLKSLVMHPRPRPLRPTLRAPLGLTTSSMRRSYTTDRPRCAPVMFSKCL